MDQFLDKLDQMFVILKAALVGLSETLVSEFPSVSVLVSIAISIVAIALLGPAIMMYLTLLERKVVGRMQNRIGPNRVGKWGLLQPLADGVKMLTKEDIVPRNADKVLHFLAPILLVAPALLVFAVLPFGKNMTAIDLNVGILFFAAISSIGTIGIFMAAWGSNNKYSVLGGMRSVAQMISYEIPMVMSVVPVILAAGSLSTNTIVEQQAGGHWFVFTPWGFLGCILFFLCGVAECNRSPFDLAEAESEIVAGFHTEYSAMKFALFYMAEFMSAFTISGMCTTLFLGGWQGPLLPSWLWFFIKCFGLIFIMLWFRATLPRLRVDQMMTLAWKFVLPLSLVNIVAACLWHFLGGGGEAGEGFWNVKAILVPLALLVVTFWALMKLNQPYMPEKRVYPLVD